MFFTLASPCDRADKKSQSLEITLRQPFLLSRVLLNIPLNAAYASFQLSIMQRIVGCLKKIIIE
jgi:hypothetical protein